MSTITLYLKDLTKAYFGGPANNTVLTFWSPSGNGTVSAGDPWLLKGSGLVVRTPTAFALDLLFMNQRPLMDASFVVGVDGSLIAFGRADSGGSIDEFGLLKTTGFQTFRAEYTIQAPALPPVLTLIDGLGAAVRASWTSHVPVADWRYDGLGYPGSGTSPVTYNEILPTGGGGISLAYLPWDCALSDAASQRIVDAMDHPSVKVVKMPTDPIDNIPYPFVIGPLPTVNWIRCTIDGIPMQAEASHVAASFDYVAGGEGTPSLEQTIRMAFKAI